MELKSLVTILQEAEQAQELLFRLYYSIDIDSGQFFRGSLEKQLLEEIKEHFKFYGGD
jgi:hypothetical protein